MAVVDLIRNEEFYCADCIVAGTFPAVTYELHGDGISIGAGGPVDEDDTTFIFQRFSVNVGNSSYVGGEASAHSSCGFFYKITGDHLNYALMTLEHGPFVSVDLSDGCAVFVSERGGRWFVRGDDIVNVQVVFGRN